MSGSCGQRIHHSVDEIALRTHDLRVFSACRKDTKLFAGEDARHFVGIQARGIDDGSRSKRFAGRSKLKLTIVKIRRLEFGCRKSDHTTIGAFGE